MDRTIRFIIVSGWAMLIIICMTIIGEACYIIYAGRPLDPSLEKLAFTAAGFLFGSLPTLIKDLLKP